MATTVETPTDRESRYVFTGVSWDDYEAMLRIVGDRPIRVTYDEGNLEIISPTFGHENLGYLLGRLVDALTEELDVPIEGGGTTTFKRQDLSKGVEPDQCYWFFQNAAKVCGRTELDLMTDPPPDLVIEVDLTRSSVPRLAIFAALGVPEVWQFADGTVRFLQLEANRYRPHESSRSFAKLNTADVVGFLQRAGTMEKTAWIKAFRAFVRDVVSARLMD